MIQRALSLHGQDRHQEGRQAHKIALLRCREVLPKRAGARPAPHQHHSHGRIKLPRSYMTVRLNAHGHTSQPWTLFMQRLWPGNGPACMSNLDGVLAFATASCIAEETCSLAKGLPACMST